MICEGCNADLSRGIDIPITMTHGQLYMNCPVCKLAMRITVVDGKVSMLWVKSSKETKASEV